MIRARPNATAWMWMLAVLLLAAAPHATHLSWPILGLCGGVAMWWGMGVWRTGDPPILAMPWRMAAVVFVLAVNYAVHEKWVAGRDPGVALLVSMMFLKLMEIKGPRDANLTMTLSYFLVTVLFFYDQSLWMGAYVLLMGLLATIALAILTRPAGPWVHRLSSARVVRRSLRSAALLVAQALPLMAILFLFFPRLSQPLWGLNEDAFRTSSSKVGLEEVMSPGSISRLTLSGETAFRVTFDGPIPPTSDLYWRGLVLWTFDGRNWRRPSLPLPSHPPMAKYFGPPVSYTLTREATHQPWLLTLDLPSELPEGAKPANDWVVPWDDPTHRLPRYRAVSYTAYRADAGLRKVPAQALQMPVRGNPKAKALARGWAESFPPAQVVEQSLLFFRREPFVYTLSPPLLTSADPVDEFLFTTRQGFCEHYAGAFVFLMRAAGVPARVVLGYQGGEVNRFSRHLTVRQSDAHAWAEVWLEGEGWRRVDPTGAVAPERVERGAAATFAGGLPEFLRGEGVFRQEFRFVWDMVQERWNRWVLGYDPERQRLFMSHLGFEGVDWEGLAAALMIGLGLFTAVAAWLLLRRRGAPPDPLVELRARLDRRLAEAGLPRRPEEGPLAIAERAAGRFPDKAGEIRDIFQDYARLRYGPDAEVSGVAALRERIRRFTLPKPEKGG
ncbi:MAG: DUF3488 domain-containing transglutaminase family protein [Magnetococcales bacterium]|nr:DUF3488 domain-containing transglutaminase family protein [Magnetococcales bacterium]